MSRNVPHADCCCCSFYSFSRCCCCRAALLFSCSPIWAVMQVIKINARFVRRRRRRCLSIFMLATLRMRNAWYV